MFSASETYCWISSPFLVLSELWLAGSTQLFWLKLLSKLTDSIWLLSASHWIALLGLKLTLTICSNLLAPSYSLASTASADLHWTAWTHKSIQLYYTVLTGLTPNWLPTEMHKLTNELHCTVLTDPQLTQPNWTTLKWTPLSGIATNYSELHCS